MSTSNTNNTDTNIDEYEEKELMPGVYVTDFRQLQHNATNTSPDLHDLNPDTLTSDLQQLDVHIHELNNSIKHLISSNDEMNEFITSDPSTNTDNILSDAIHENKLIIQRKYDEISMYSKLRDQLNQHVSEQVDAGKNDKGVFL